MITLQLIHPYHGIVKEVYLGQKSDIKNAIYQWKHLYGKKFLECEVKQIGQFTKDVIVSKTQPSKRVVHIITGEVFNDEKDAALKLGITVETIRKHCRRKLKGRVEYIVKYQ